MNVPAHLTPEAAGLLDASIEARMAYLKELPFVAHPAMVRALQWLSYLRRFDSQRDRPRNLHVIGVAGIGKSRLLRHYAQQHQPGCRSQQGWLTRPVLLVEAPEDGNLKKLSDRLFAACMSGQKPLRVRGSPDRVEDILRLSGVRQVLIDEAGNLLYSTRSHHHQCLAFLKRLSNAGFTVAIATTENLQTVLAADEQLHSRFKQILLPRWQESDELRGFLKVVESSIPLRDPSDLASAALVRWFAAQQCLRTASILEVIRDAAHIAFSEAHPCLTVALLQRAISGTAAPDVHAA